MKKLLIPTLLLLICCTETEAQNWKDALTKAATNAVDQATGGKLTALAIVGHWEYSGPGVKLESDDTVSELGGAAIASGLENKLAPVYRMVGIRPGACRFTFEKDNSFSALLGSRELSGTYEFDPSTHDITLHLDKAVGKSNSLTGRAYLSGAQMQLVFPSEKLMDLITGLGAKISSLKTLTASLEKYRSIALGFNFSK